MGTEDTQTPNQTPDINLAEIREQEITRVRSITALGDRHNLAILAEQLIDGGKSVEEARAVFDRHLTETNNQKPLGRTSHQDANLAGFGTKEDKEYSLMRAIRSICPGFSEYNKNCSEREISQEIGQKIGRTTAGVFVPVRHLRVGVRDRDALTTVGSASNLIDTDFRGQDFIEALRNQAKVFQLGARFMTGLMGPVEIPKQTGTSTAYWIGEGQAITESDLNFGQIGMSQKTIVSRVSMTRNLLMQSSLSVENIVREDMIREIALAIDKAAISGSGVGPEPKGILNYAINSVPLATDGAAPSFADIVAMTAEIEDDNADLSTMKWLTNTKVKAKLMLTPMQSSGVEGNFVLKDPSNLMGYSFNVSNQVPKNLTKGNGTNLSALILGCWDQLIVGEWGVLEILPNIYGKQYEVGGVEIRCIKSLDMCLRHEQSFCAITDAITTL
jgi:HK97 family phage major capsid protein